MDDIVERRREGKVWYRGKTEAMRRRGKYYSKLVMFMEDMKLQINNKRLKVGRK